MDNQGSLERNQPVVANPHVVTANPQPRQEVVKIVNRGLSGGKVAALLIVSVVLSVLIGAGSMLLVFHFFPNLTKDNVTNVTRVEKEVSITYACRSVFMCNSLWKF